MIRLGSVVGSDLFGLWSHHVDLGIRELKTHQHVMGLPGMGKTKLVESTFLQRLKRELGTTLIDPTGGAAEDILAYLIKVGFFNKPENFEKLLYVEFAD